MFSLVTDSIKNFYMHVYRAALSISMTTILGKRLDRHDSPECRLVEDTTREWNQYLLPSTFRPIDIFPSLRHWPAWMPWNRRFNYIKSLKRGSFETLYREFEIALESGSSSGKQCFMNTVLNRREEFGFKTKSDLRWVPFYMELW
jgi:hypothetical protein